MRWLCAGCALAVRARRARLFGLGLTSSHGSLPGLVPDEAACFVRALRLEGRVGCALVQMLQNV